MLQQKPPLFAETPNSIVEDAQRLIERVRYVQQQILETVQAHSATFENVLLPLARLENAISAELGVIRSYTSLSTDSIMLEASGHATTLFDAFITETYMNASLFNLVDNVLSNGESLDAESRRFLEKRHKNYVRNGFLLPEGPIRNRFREIQSRLNHLKTACLKNLAKTRVDIWLPRQAFGGVPDTILTKMQTGTAENEGKLLFTEHNIAEILSYATNSDTRKLIYESNENKCRQNEPMFKEMILLRDEAARLLGYPNHAAFRLEDMMAKTPDTVDNFHCRLVSQLSSASLAEVDKLKKLKRMHVESRGEAFDDRYFFWDNPFYHRLMLEKEGSFDMQLITEYFSLQSTMQVMLDIVQHLFGLIFTEICDHDRRTAAGIVWHEDVRIFTVWDDKHEGGGFVGYFYLDLFDRENKPPSARCVPIIPGCELENGIRQFPATALIFDFAKPTTQNPTLLQHREVILLFHELGHGIHDLVARTKFACFHGTASPVDFAEAPSQMLENWCWIPSQLKRLGRHYSYLSPEYFEAWASTSEGRPQPPEQLSDVVINRLVNSKHVNGALFYLRQVSISMFDMMVHELNGRPEPADWNLAVKWNQLRREVLPIDGGEAGAGQDWAWSHGYANFSHFIADYDASYFSYTFSLVYAADIFYSVFKADPESARLGRRYRHTVLEKGASEDEMEVLTDFLGRKPNINAFSTELNII